MYEHHLLAALLLTGCKMPPVSNKTPAPLHDTQVSPSLWDLEQDKEQSRGQQGTPVWQPRPPDSGMGEQRFSTWGHAPDALRTSLPTAPIKDAPLPPFSYRNNLFWPQKAEIINSKQGFGSIRGVWLLLPLNHFKNKELQIHSNLESDFPIKDLTCFYAFEVTIFVRLFVQCIVCMCSYTRIGLIKVNWCIIRAAANTKEWLQTRERVNFYPAPKDKQHQVDITAEQ